MRRGRGLGTDGPGNPLTARRGAARAGRGSGRTRGVGDAGTSRVTSARSPGSPGPTPVWAGLTTATRPLAHGRDRGGGHRLADVRPGARDDQDSSVVHPGSTSASTVAARARSASVRSARAVSRRQLRRPAPTAAGSSRPARRLGHAAAAATALRVAEDRRDDGRGGAGTPADAASSAAAREHRGRPFGLGRQHAQRRERRAGGRRREPGVEDERAGRVDQHSITARARAPRRPARPATSTASRCRRRPAAGQPGLGRAPPVRPEDAERVRLVDDEQRAVGAGDRVQRGSAARSPSTENTASVTTIARSAVRAASARRSRRGRGAGRRRPASRKPAAVDQRRVVAGVGHDRASGPPSAVSTPTLAR